MNAGNGKPAAPARAPVVNSWNEWGLLEEVIVGVMDGAAVPPWHVTLKATMPEKHWGLFQRQGGRPFDPERVRAAEADLEGLARLLEREGVRVRRPDRVNFVKPYASLASTIVEAAGRYASDVRNGQFPQAEIPAGTRK